MCDEAGASRGPMEKKRSHTVVHLFAGSGGCTLGFKRAGLRSLGSFDFDPKACRDLERLTGGPAFCVDLQTMKPAELAAYTGGECPEVVVGSPPCKSFSGCMPAARAGEERYVDMSLLAVWGVELVLKAWAPKMPRIILIENVPQMATRGRVVVEQVTHLLRKAGYSVDVRSHCCGKKGGLAQRRKRILIVARHVETCPDFLRQPPDRPLRTVGEVLGVLPSPAAAHGDELHRLPLLSPLNWLRLAAIRAGKDWRDLPAEIVIGGEHTDPRANLGPNAHSGIYGVEDSDGPAHVVTGNARPGSTWGGVADPRVHRGEGEPGSWGAKGHPDHFGVGDWTDTAPTVRGRQEVQTSRAAVADPRVGWDPERHAGRPDSYGVGGWDATSGTIRALQTTQTTRASVADPRLGCKPRKGHYGVVESDKPAGTVIGYHVHDRAPASVADPRLSYRNAERVARADRRVDGGGFSGRGDYGVLDPDAPAPTIRSRHEVRQAPAAVVDDRGWPVPTHELIREDDGRLVLYGPPIDLASKRPCLLVIRAPDGTWHRPMTDRELAVLQGFPVDCYLEGPSSSSKGAPGRREHIGNAIPAPAAEAFGREVVATLDASDAGEVRLLAGGDIWVEPEERAAC